MLELARDLLPLLHSGAAVAAVTVTRVARSAPRGAGATMAVTDDGRVLGSISGGCVEGDAVVLAHSARVGGSPLTARLGFSDDAAHAAGLACGGSVDVVAYRLSPEPAVIAALESAAAGLGVTAGVVLGGSAAGRVLDEGELRTLVARGCRFPTRRAGIAQCRRRVLVRRRRPRSSHRGPRDRRGLSGDAHGARHPRAVARTDAPSHVVGAGEHAAALCRVATAAGFAVTVLRCLGDPRHRASASPRPSRCIVGLPARAPRRDRSAARRRAAPRSAC